MRGQGRTPGGERTTPHGETPYSPTSLLRALTADPYSVDPLREEEHPVASATPPDNRRMRTLTLLLAAVLGFVVAVSVLDLRDQASGADSPRALLEQEVLDVRAETDGLEDRRTELEGQIASAQQEVLDAGGDDAAQRLGEYEQAGGGVAMSGEGVVLSLDDSAPLPSRPGAGPGTVNRVTDGDLQIAVNGLWAAGAEAVSVNGQRVSSTTAIRTAGSAVLVDFRPLSPPYEITALGDPAQLRDGVQDAETGDYLSEISTRYGIGVSWTTGEDLTVPARALGTLREARRTDDEGEQPGDPAPDTAPDTTSDSAAAGGAEQEDSP
jgi:uncharacterized protein YlxW (UPF0749 family)